MKNYLFPFFLLAILFSACTKDDIATNKDDEKVAYDPAKVVCFTTESLTRGTPITAVSQMTNIGVFCAYTPGANWSDGAVIAKMFNEKLTRNASGVWEYGDAPMEWNATSSDDRYTFFAYAPYASGVYNATTDTGNGIVVDDTKTTGIPEITYTVPEKCEKQPDLMVSVPCRDTRPQNAPVVLNMQHALTCVGFEIKIESGIKNLSSIKVAGVAMSGTLALGGGTDGAGDFTDAPVWRTNPATADYSVLLNSKSPNWNSTNEYYIIKDNKMSTDLLAGNGYLMMIPQTLGAGAKITLTFDDGGAQELSLSGHEWEMGGKVIYQITLTASGTIIAVDPSHLELPYTGVNHKTDNLEVITVDGQSWTLASNDSWLTLTTNADGSGASQTITGTGSCTVYTIATANGSTTDSRSTTITLDGLSDICTVVQLQKIDVINGIGTTLGDQTYVGAFWRGTQTGERLIHIPVGATNTGDWIATVIWKDSQWAEDDIILDAPTKSPTYPVAGDAEAKQLSGDQTTVGGSAGASEYIHFRIGLRTQYTTAPRYAVIAISYKDYTATQFLYIRQGEGDDVMDGSGVKWSVYNSRPTQYSYLAANQGSVTTVSYPTMAGGMKQWNDEAIAGFCTPVDPNIGPTWRTSITAATIGTACPSGYRVPSGAASNGGELGSLIKGTTSGWGYYADGYFDRGKITYAQMPQYTFRAINRDDFNGVAYIGRIFINSSTKATLFFPATGARSSTSGNVTALGNGAYYWTRTQSTSNASAYYLSLGIPTGSPAQNSQSKVYAGPIRCVRN